MQHPMATDLCFLIITESYCHPNMRPHLSVRDPAYKKEFKMTSKLF